MRNRVPTFGDLGARIDLRALGRRPFLVLLVALGSIEVARLLLDPHPIDVLVLALVGIAGYVAVREQEAAGIEGTRRTEAESFARILRGLARSVSPDAIVDAIVEELGVATGADHVAVVRRRPEGRSLEAILSSTRPGSPTSRTTLPLSELEDPAEDEALADLAVAAARGRRLTAVPIEPDPDGDPQLVPLGIAADRLAVVSGGAGREGLALDRAPTAVAVAPAPYQARGRGRHAAPAREGADQRIADRLADRLRASYGLSNVVAAPLRVNGRVEGAIVLSRRTRVPWPASAGRILEAAAAEASAALARVYSLREAEARATTDALTGLPNRRYFDEYLGLLAKRRRAEDQVGVLMIDIDRFKKLNDTFGHAVGDHVLREVGQAIAGAVREGDVPARFGGEEFAVLLKNPGPDVAVEVGERVRKAVSSLDLRNLGVPGVSVSVGVSVASSPDQLLEDVIDEADQALYRAKRGGRDRVVAA
ncbi:MAG TPA: GGDEF domain-containing protein [Candidatus Limnocylindrales bacterium]|nr:GGDEF domain-containing protein [Candidatus Limnocylindrales bacterium]